MPPNDLQVTLEQAVAGDEEALALLLEQAGPIVERGLRIARMWRGVLEASDVMQVTYLEAFLRIGHFNLDRPESFESWLRRIAQNNLRDAIRGLERQKRPQPGKRLQVADHTESLLGLYEVLGATTTTPSRNVRRDEASDLLDKAIEALPDDYGQVVRSYDLQGQSIHDVAALLGRTPGAVHMLRARAHERLREHLRSASLFL